MTTLPENRAVEPFITAIGLPKEERARYLEDYCGDDVTLLEELKLLLSQHDKQPGNLIDDIIAANESPPREGEQIEHYRLLRKIGSGGMSDVYLAERTDGVYDTHVAVKLFRGSRDDTDLVHRFYRERQILSALSHPYICNLLDGGATDDKLPFYVMEYIEGTAIDDYCHNHALTIQQRLELFLKVCNAVSFAHRHLVIHRDLKPSNILVTEDGEPRLLDFGIAKLLGEPSDAASTTTTILGLLPLTLRYASPEQLRGDVLTTATDVYSLGVVLYELLTGKSPYSAGDQLELIEQVRDAEAPPMSRVVEEKDVSRLLAGDLDNIVAKTLQKAPNQRYQSVRQLTEDIERYLTSRPVLARKASLWYRADRFIRRYRLILSTVTVAVVAITTVGVTLQLQILRERDVAERERYVAEQERDRLEQVKELLVGFFEIPDPTRGSGNSITAREILDRGAEKVDQTLEDQPEIRAELLDTLGAVYRKLGLYDESERMLRQSLNLKERIAPQSVSVANTLNHYARLLIDMVENRKAEDVALRALELYLQHPQPPQDKIAEVYDALGTINRKLANYQDAIDYHQRALAIGKAALGGQHASIAQYHSNIGTVYRALGNQDLAIEYYDEALLIYMRESMNSGAAAVTYRRLGIAHWMNEEHQLAIEYFRKGLALAINTLGEKHPEVGWFYSNLGNTYAMRGEYDKAIEYFKKQLKLNEEAGIYNNLGAAFTDKGNYDEALDYLQKALRIDNKENLLTTATIYTSLGQVYTLKSEYNTAIQYFEEALSFGPAAMTPDHPSAAEIHQGMGKAFEGKSEYSRALQHYETAFEIRMKIFGAEHSMTKSVQADLARVQQLAGMVQPLQSQ